MTKNTKNPSNIVVFRKGCIAMIDSTKESYKIIFTIINHEHLGWIVECYAVKLGDQDQIMLTNQKIHPTTAVDFHLTEKQTSIVKIIDELDKKVLVNKFNPKKTKVKVEDFFAKLLTPEIKVLMSEYITKRVIKILPLLIDEHIFLSSEDNQNVAARELRLLQEPAGVYFHLYKNEDGLQYFPNIKHLDETINYRQNNSIVLTNQPVWMVVEDKLLHLDPKIDDKKIIPFIPKKFIQIPLSTEETYLKKFIVPLVEKYPVFATGIDVVTERFIATPILKLTQMGAGLSCLLSFRYGNSVFTYNTKKMVYAKLEREGDAFIIKKIQRSSVWEEHKKQLLKDCGFVHQIGASFHAYESNTIIADGKKNAELLELLIAAKETLINAGFEIIQENNKYTYLIEEPKFEANISEGNDFFDIKAMVRFGEFEVPFAKLIGNIKKKQAEFTLPNGQIAIIPEEWFTKYLPLVNFAKLNDDELQLKKHHQALLSDLEDKPLFIGTTSSANFIPITHIKTLNATLRGYQLDGINWLLKLHQLKCGGILADDMGLGKTVQVIGYLAHLKEISNKAIQHLVVAPTSLVYNWQKEIANFCPSLKVYVHLGVNRPKELKIFYKDYDVILTSYGTLRADIVYFEPCNFNVLITDESQSYKNRKSLINKKLHQISKKHTIALTGTPIENGITDLWSQIDIVNPKMLGSYTYFKNNFVDPIEKKEDENAAKQLQKIIDPFVLRRTKKQVVLDLPTKTEHIISCPMTEEQGKLYDEVKSYYRNHLLDLLEDVGANGGRMQILAGIMKLRQIANHPILAGYDEHMESGKLKILCSKIDTAIKGGHKILVFSQFLGHLALIKSYLETQHITHSYIDGSMSAKERDLQVETFQNNEECKVFLLSIKTGDKGLNLTAADYVMIADPWWNPAVEQQAQDRAYRIGQDKPVVVFKFITENTIEDKIKHLQNRKKSYAQSVIIETDLMDHNIDKETIEMLFS